MWVGSGVGLSGGGCRGGCERRIEVFEKFIKTFFLGGARGPGVGLGGGQGRCERTIKVFVKIKKKMGGGVGGGQVGGRVGGGVRVDVNEELKFL